MVTKTVIARYEAISRRDSGHVPSRTSAQRKTNTMPDSDVLKAVESIKHIPGWRSEITDMMLDTPTRINGIINLCIKSDDMRRQFINTAKTLLTQHG